MMGIEFLDIFPKKAYPCWGLYRPVFRSTFSITLTFLEAGMKAHCRKVFVKPLKEFFILRRLLHFQVIG
jgi:hypothetical protein